MIFSASGKLTAQKTLLCVDPNVHCVYVAQMAFSSPVRPVSSQIDTADAQVVTTAHKSRLQFQGSPVGGNSLFRAAPVGQGGT